VATEPPLVDGDAAEVRILERAEPTGDVGRGPAEGEAAVPEKGRFGAGAGADCEGARLNLIGVLAARPEDFAVGVLGDAAIGVLDGLAAIADELVGLEDDCRGEAVAEGLVGQPEAEHPQEGAIAASGKTSYPLESGQ